MTLRKISPSLPDIPTAAAAMARFCGLTILPSTPPEEFAAAISTGSSPAWPAVCTWRPPNSAFDDVSDPVTATPIQPRIGDSSANAPPAPASHAASEEVCPDRFITYASASTAITVTIAERSSTYVRPYVRSAVAGAILRINEVMMPAMIISVPAAGSQLSVYVVLATGSPAGLNTSRPGQWNR